MVRLTVIKPDQQPEQSDYREPVEITIGRSSSNVICLDADPLVSRRHAVLSVEPPSVRIKDLNSTNGITINGEHFGAQSEQKLFNPLELRDGDEIIIGHTRIRIGVTEDDTPPRDGVVAFDSADYPRITSRYVDADAVESAADRSADQTIFSADEDTARELGRLPPKIPGYIGARHVASGMFGEVYQAVSRQDGSVAAVKTFAPQAHLLREALDEMSREFEASRSVGHPNLARLFGVGQLEEGEGVFLAAEFVSGESLSQYLKNLRGRRVALHDAFNLMLHITGAVCRLHRDNLTHLDVKPSAIMVFQAKGRLTGKLTDTGMTGFLGKAGLLRQPYDGSDAEKLACLSPEAVGRGHAPAKTDDVFALTSIFYTLLTGFPPYRFTDGGDNRLVVERGDMLPVDDITPRLPEPLMELLEKGLAPKAEQRFQSACELLDAFENVWV